MTREQFESYLDAPELITAGDVPELKAMLDKFPYCQTSRLLYVVSLRNQKSISFDDQLNLMAAYSADRKSLYYLINPVMGSNRQQFDNRDGDQEDVAASEVATAGNDMAEEKEEEVQQTAEQENEGEVKMSAPFDLTGEDESHPDEYVLSENHLHELVGASLSFDLQKMMEEGEHSKEDEQRSEKANPEPLPKSAQGDEKHHFSDWLNIFDTGRTEKVSEHDLIDEFLKKAPKIKSQPKQDTPTLNLARHSATPHEDLITETLAKIHVEQGNINKAVEIYEKLSLKYPEKRSYFAAQIKFLKHKP